MNRIFFLLFLILTTLGCESPTPTLARFTQERSFFYDNYAYENALFYADNRTVFPLCTDSASFNTLCSAPASAKQYIKSTEVTQIGTYPALTRWKLRFAELQKDQLVLMFDPPPGNLVEPSLHPLAWLETDATTGRATLNLTPVYPGLQFSTRDLTASDIGPLSLTSTGEFETQISFKIPALLGYELTWKDRLRLNIKFKRAFTASKTVVIDAGHGGEESGACEESLCEKDLTLKAARILQTALEASSIKALLTRQDDSTLPLYDRVIFAEKAKADLLISLHVDNWSSGGKLRTPHGISCYYFQPFSLITTQEICGSDLSSQDPVADWITKRSLHILHSTNFPSILIELANFADNKDLILLQNEQRFQSRILALAERIKNVLRMPPSSVTH